jgi:hypothetical protein
MRKSDEIPASSRAPVKWSPFSTQNGDVSNIPKPHSSQMVGDRHQTAYWMISFTLPISKSGEEKA